MVKISCITPSVRPKGLPIVARCLDRQTFTDWEWIVGSPKKLKRSINKLLKNFFYFDLIQEPEKRKEDYYNLNKCWNALFKKSSGELIISIVDWIWFPPDTLERFLHHYEANSFSCITAIGHQYEREVAGRPEGLVWTDPRINFSNLPFFETNPTDFELCLASLPRKAIFDVGGIDEEFDKYAALSEKEMCKRISKVGYQFYTDKDIEYRAVKHSRLNELWDEKYKEGIPYFQECLRKIDTGKRLKLDFLKEGEE